jgi:hypothetical protein
MRARVPQGRPLNASLSPRLAAALLRTAYGDSEEDVRAAARHTLILRNEVIGDIIHFSLILDADPYVRDSAFDEALEVSDPQRRLRLLQQASHALINDPLRFCAASYPVAAGQPRRAHIR